MTCEDEREKKGALIFSFFWFQLFNECPCALPGGFLYLNLSVFSITTPTEMFVVSPLLYLYRSPSSLTFSELSSYFSLPLAPRLTLFCITICRALSVKCCSFLYIVLYQLFCPSTPQPPCLTITFTRPIRDKPPARRSSCPRCASPPTPRSACPTRSQECAAGPSEGRATRSEPRLRANPGGV